MMWKILSSTCHVKWHGFVLEILNQSERFYLMQLIYIKGMLSPSSEHGLMMLWKKQAFFLLGIETFNHLT